MNRKSIRISICLILILILSLSLSGTSFALRGGNVDTGSKQISAPIVENLKPSSETTKMTYLRQVPSNVDIISNQITISNEENAKPASETTKMTSQKAASLDADVNPMSLSRPTKGTNLPYSGAFSGVNTEIFSNYYFFTNGSTQLYVDWNVKADYPANVLWHINVYQAGTNKFVASSDKFQIDSNTGWWTTRFYNLDPAYNYYISFVNDGPQIGSPISGDFTVRLK
ncbi:hypothetical protein Tthe_2660 [Thermoanaerobacterium thermosaccharolyticum DSM 571]|uniref:Uncharacterized protein n=1 Tax=Thermoanaerobacterium thermosaccharolyticum (strain ATCC 7956 / DSM 571 / NCIMB 9385 / NCA 3814 / NCTC 13789 / WDCM 00135 / 2032) TaxID=580327 RepID=D9TMR0_THETC|nr:hypothetical protein [Thermoanaerobacterium thermosaccharolyticum]ADL70110.1 hypothetical protein Tthe_2660 [Thermoanaerobacterium thermosaccharolyticum DSM 571]